jgi:hypothetical protein
MEFPIEFFLTMARTPARWYQNHLDDYTETWASRAFGPEHAREIADAVELYTRFNARRKPEHLTPTTFSLTNFDEAAHVDREWRDLSASVDKIANEPSEAADTSARRSDGATHWEELPGFGETRSAMTVMPVNQLPAPRSSTACC